MESGKAFKVGSGLSDKQHKNPPKLGTIITYLTRDGVPRFPTFVGKAVDKDAPKDAEVPEHRKHRVTVCMASERTFQEDMDVPACNITRKRKDEVRLSHVSHSTLDVVIRIERQINDVPFRAPEKSSRVANTKHREVK
ncbi:hypothetical protein BDZ89DRAFT_1045804 [Hymenopellis radicata]|nr:hypothetical protein BDZ89DRAFT_1045804 [Hymenopellis radicata]